VAERQVTPAAAWRKPRLEGYTVTLPSGNTVRLRPVALDMLILTGKLPDLLTPIAARSLWVDTNADAIGKEVELARGFTELVNIVVPAALLEPCMVDDPQADNEIGPNDMDFADKLAVFQLATQPAEVLRQFREQQTGSLATLSNGDGDRPTAQRTGKRR